MARAADANELRCLLSLAGRLRQLAAGALFQHDQVLYLLAAEALEKHSAWLATAPPDQRATQGDLEPYRPVDIIV